MSALDGATRVSVGLAGRSYDILIARGLLADAGQAIEAAIGRRRLVVISDETVAALHLPALARSLDAVGLRHDAVIVPAGETSKDLHRFPALAERVLDLGIDRKTVLVALGGGVVGDLAGFLAAVLLRELDFVQVPTTLLAQIDSSVGGKTGTNTRQGKNLVGSFHQPRLVLADLDVLATLPRRELLAGYGEMIKYGLIADRDFFERMEHEVAALLDLAPEPLAAAVARCCRMKAEIVAADEREGGARALLNLGHTFGHALEAETGFGDALLHGESVSIGIGLAADLSVRLGLLDGQDATRIRAHLDRAGVPSRLDQVHGFPFSADRLIAHMRHDKKTSEGELTFILLDGIGSGVIRKVPELDAVRAVLSAAGAV